MKKTITLLSLIFSTHASAACTYFVEGPSYYGYIQEGLEKNGWKIAKSMDEAEVVIRMSTTADFVFNPIALAAMGHTGAKIVGLKGKTVYVSARAYKSTRAFVRNVQCGNEVLDPASMNSIEKASRKIVRKMGTCEE